MKKLLICLIWFTLIGVAEATDRYVIPGAGGTGCSNGSNNYHLGSNTCSGGTDQLVYTSIANGLTAMAGGDTLLLRAGTYAETIGYAQVPSGSSWNTATTISAYPSENVIITGAGGFGGIRFQSPGTGVTKEYIIFKGTGTHNFILDGPASGGQNAVILGGGGNGGVIRYVRLDGITIRNVRSTDCIAMGGGDTPPNVSGHHLELINSVLYNCGALVGSFGHAVYITTNDNLIENNLIYDGTGFGIHAHYDGSLQVHRNLIRRNIVHDVCTGRVTCSGIIAGQGDDNEISNNLVYNIFGSLGDGGIGIGVDYGPTSGHPVLIYGNTVYNTTWFGIDDNTADGTRITNNILSATGTAGSGEAFSALGTNTVYTNNLCSATGPAATNCSYTNEAPTTTFVTPGTNFTLKAGSAAIDHGTTLGIPFNIDQLNIARPQGAGYDIGALELVTSGTPPVVTITSPTSAATFNTSSTTIAVSGTSDLSSGSVTWSCNRCTPATGTASGTSSWSLPTLTLKAGINILTITATTSVGASSNDTLSITYAPTFPGNSLVAAYAFDEGSGTSAADTSGNGNTGTLVNTPTWNPNGRYGQAIQFDGLTEYITVSDSNSLDLTQGFSITAYVMPLTVQTDFRGLVIKNALPLANPYALYASSIGDCGAGGISGYSDVNGTSGPFNEVCSAGPLQVNVWTHLALTWDGASMRLYKNGTLVASVSHTGYIEPSNGTLQIAATEYGEYFKGVIDELRIYNYAIPLTGGANTVFGNNCTRADETSTPSVIGDANCPIAPPVSPLIIKIGAAAAGLKISGTVKLGSTSGAQ